MWFTETAVYQNMGNYYLIMKLSQNQQQKMIQQKPESD
jgi:hypothetical protein